MEYSFDVEDAKRHGVTAAVLLKNIKFWIARSKANGRNYYDGNWWTYNSIRAFKELYPFWNEAKIRRALKRLEDNGVIITGNYNKTSYDRTLWYAVIGPDKYLDSVNSDGVTSDFGLSEISEASGDSDKSILQNNKMDFQKSKNQFVQNDEPIPDNNTNSNPDNNTDKNTKGYANLKRSAKQRGTPTYPSSFEDWYKSYPNPQNKKQTLYNWILCVEGGAKEADLLIAAQRYAEHCKKEGVDKKYIKHSTTFLGPSEPWRDWIRAGLTDMLVEVCTKCGKPRKGTEGFCLSCGEEFK